MSGTVKYVTLQSKHLENTCSPDRNNILHSCHNKVGNVISLTSVYEE